MFQCQKFREAFCGSYVTKGERFVLIDGILTLKEKFEGSLDINTDDDAGAPTAYDGWRVAINEKRDELALGDVILKPIDFDGLARGSFEVGGLAANGEAFSFARADGDRLACDVWTAYEKRLLTCRAVYEGARSPTWMLCGPSAKARKQKARASSTCTRNSAPRGPRCGSRAARRRRARRGATPAAC